MSVKRRARLRQVLADRWTVVVMAALGLLGAASALQAPVPAFSLTGIVSMAVLFWLWLIGRFLVDDPVRFWTDLQRGIAVLAVGGLLVAWAGASLTLTVASVSLRVLGPENKGMVLGLGGNGLGPLLVYGGILALGRASQPQPLSTRLEALLLAAAMLVSPVALGVRNAAWGGLAGAVLLLPVTGLVPVVVVAGAVAVALAVEPELWGRFMRLADLASEEARLGVWQSALAMIRDHPWLGVGPNHFATVHPAYALPQSAHLQDPHSIYLRIASEWGLPAAAVLFSWLMSWPARLWPLRRQVWRWSLVAAFGSFLAMGIFDTPIFTFHISAPVMVGLGLAAADADSSYRTKEGAS